MGFAIRIIPHLFSILFGTYHVLDSIILYLTLYHNVVVCKHNMMLEEDANMPTCNLDKIFHHIQHAMLGKNDINTFEATIDHLT